MRKKSKGVIPMKPFMLLLWGMAVAAIAAAASPYTTPPGGSATGVPSSTQGGLVPNTPSGGAGETVFIRNSSGQSYRGFVPYGSSFYYNRSSGSSIQRLTSDPSASRVAGSSSYFDPRTGMRMDFSKPSTGGSNPMVNPYAPSNLPQTANTQYSLQPRPITTRPEDLTRDLNRRINPDLLADGFKSKTDINTLAKEAHQKANQQQIDPALLLPATPDSQINSNLGQVSPEQQETLNRYERIKNQMLEELRQSELDAARKKSDDAESQDADEAEERLETESGSSSGGHSTRSQRASASPITDRTMDYFAAAEEYLNEGRFYKAADTYALAAVWQPENALAYAGQSWALFGAGEYMSSAYYLSRAITLNPKLAGQKINVAAILRDRDVFENRLIEMAGSHDRNKSGEMAFLLAYILWQDGKTQRAEEMIRLAAERMPEDAAVKTLLGVITAPPAQETPAAETTVADSNQIGK
jgi:hypothetical protein